jgi:hypothetical protein
MKSAGICKTASWRELTDLYIISNAPLLLMFLPLYTATRRRVEEEEEEDTPKLFSFVYYSKAEL